MPQYMSGFANHFQTEALKGALPEGQNSPRQCAYGLYAEQFNGTAFTAPRMNNRRSWLYRIRPSVKHSAYFEPYAYPFWQSAPYTPAKTQALEPMRWDPLPVPTESMDFVEGIRTISSAGDVNLQTGFAIHCYLANQSMDDHYLQCADGELLIVPQQGRLLLHTEMGSLVVSPSEIAVIPKGVIFQVMLEEGFARGYICENYALSFELPERGPLGSNSLAAERDFLYPIARYDDSERTSKITLRWGGETYQAENQHSPLDVVAWHGNLAPYKYDLKRFATVGSISFDHPDPSIFTVLTAPSLQAGVANIDFAIFPERWLVAKDTFRPPWYHRNIMSEFMGLIYGEYDAKPNGFSPGAMSLHNMLLPHGPDAEAFDKGCAETDEPIKLNDTLAFMFETHLAQKVTDFAYHTPQRQIHYRDCWKALSNKFNPNNRGG